MSQNNEIERARREALSGVASAFDLIYSESERILLHITMDEYISSLTKSNPTSYSEKMTFVASVSKIINTLIYHEEYIHSISLYFDESDFFFSTTGDNGTLNTISDHSWYNEYTQKRDKINFWASNRKIDNHTNHEVISIYKVISQGSKACGVAIINIDLKKLDSLLQDTVSISESSFFMLDENKNIIYSTASKSFLPDKSLFNDIISQNNDSSSSSIVTLDKKDYIISYMQSGYNRWNYASVTNLSNFNNRMSSISFFAAACFLLMLLIEIIIAFSISVKMYKPIKKIIDLLDNPEKWVSATSEDLILGANELKYIENNILNKYNENSQLKTELEAKLIALKKVTATVLQTQMNPHFLYNTLESINWKARRLLGAKNEISDMILTLSNILRYNLNPSNGYILLKDEINHAHTYMSLQATRYKNKFDVTFDIPDELYKLYTIKFLLQPILENAIYHGIKPSDRKCTVNVSAKKQDEFLIITVSDDGVGINEANLKKLNDNLNDNSDNFTKHIGLKNTNQRIKLLCGENYGISIQSTENVKTTITVKLPVTITQELNAD